MSRTTGIGGGCRCTGKPGFLALGTAAFWVAGTEKSGRAVEHDAIDARAIISIRFNCCSASPWR